MGKHIFCAFSLLSLAACGTGHSEDVKQSSIEKSYTLSYDANQSSLEAQAQFAYESLMGTTLELTGQSSIHFDGLPMRFMKLFQRAQYVASQYSSEPPSRAFAFRYTNNEGQWEETQLTIPRPLELLYPRPQSQVSRQKNLSISLRGMPLSADEEIHVCLHYEESEGTSMREREECLYSQQSLSVTFSQEQLASFPQGAELTLIVTRDRQLEDEATRRHIHESLRIKDQIFYLAYD